MLHKLIAAAKLMDSIYIRQVWSGNEALLHKLVPDAREIAQFFGLAYAEFDRRMEAEASGSATTTDPSAAT